MSATWLLGAALVAFLIAFFTYGSAVGRWLGVDPSRTTPAHDKRDGVDYVPAKTPVLVGHHFASIAGAAPIIGPVTALAFGWLPVYLWIVLGVIFLGAVHDFASLVASLRHEGKSIGEVVEAHLGHLGKTLFLIFAWATLILVVAVFAIVVAKTFVEVPEAATASLLFIVLAVLFGVALNRFRAPLGIATLFGVPLLVGCLLLGQVFPLSLAFETWIGLLLVYVFIASVTPVWILLQPRDYLNSFLLYGMLLLGILGIVVTSPKVEAPAVTSFHVEGLGYLFPVLFVTVACGAISGFHSLVSSGTTAKQLDRESDARTVAYGSMLLEAVLAIVALIAVIYLSPQRYASFMGKGGAGPVAAFSAGLGEIIGSLGLPVTVMSSFVALTVSAFALTSLDTATRLARFAFQEFFEPRRDREKTPSKVRDLLAGNRFLATGISVTLAGLLAYSGRWKQLWPIFGSANQLLAALALLAVSAWLAKRAKQNAFVKIPMVLMFGVTLSSLAILVHHHLTADAPNHLLALVAAALLVVALVLAGLSFRVLFPHTAKYDVGSQIAGGPPSSEAEGKGMGAKTSTLVVQPETRGP